MKYMLLIYNNPEMLEAFSQEERDEIFSQVDGLIRELTETGEWLGGEGLAHPSQAKTIRVRDGVPAITDGPFVEAKEQFAGYCMLDCETLERATEIALRWPDARYAAVELRPLMRQSGTEM